jgi:hypothetical protein
MGCAKCGAANVDGSSFCAGCGGPLEAASSFCNKCGTKLSAGAAFCVKCGKNVSAAPMALVPYRPPVLAVPPPVMMVHGGFGCPRCGSPVTHGYKTIYIVLAVLLFPIGLLFLTAPKERRCMNFRCQFTY